MSQIVGAMVTACQRQLLVMISATSCAMASFRWWDRRFGVGFQLSFVSVSDLVVCSYEFFFFFFFFFLGGGPKVGHEWGLQV